MCVRVHVLHTPTLLPPVQIEVASASEAKDVLSDGMCTASPKRFGKKSAARVPADGEERTIALLSSTMTEYVLSCSQIQNYKNNYMNHFK